MHQKLAPRILGFLGSLLLTLASFSLIAYPSFFHLQVDSVIPLILILAMLQFLVQSVCFINLWSEQKTRWNLLVFISTLSIIIIIIVASIWIMDHLNYRHMH